MQRARRPTQRLPQALVSGRILVVAAHVLQPLRQFRKRVGIDTAFVLEAVARPLAQLVQVHAREPCRLRHSRWPDRISSCSAGRLL